MEEDKNENEINEVNYEEIKEKNKSELEKLLVGRKFILKDIKNGDVFKRVYIDSTMEKLSKKNKN